MRVSLLAPAAVAIALVSQAGPVLSHAGVQPREARVGAPYRASVSIPHGCEGSTTKSVRVVIPEGVIGVKPMPKAGWTVSTTRGAYARSYPYYHGAVLKEGVKEIVWSGALADENYDEFVFVGFLADTLPAGEMLRFPVYQTCEQGVAEWTEVPAPGQDAHALAKPAPAISLLPAAAKTVSARFTVGSLVIETPWIRATPDGAKVAAGYLKVTNTGTTVDTLTGGAASFANALEVHEMSMVDGVMKMRRLEAGLAIAPGQTVELKPGGHHLMFIGLQQTMKDGQTVKGTLEFEKAGKLGVDFRIAPIGASSTGAHSHH